ncbi:hypothetical protein ACH5RR_006794 [Cinchona calisaya]|uniref:Uncharacterized protein n=1 Tax=Cinchona calisaya TaxID=153742 RepID=A0ABD3AQ00_9GENT
MYLDHSNNPEVVSLVTGGELYNSNSLSSIAFLAATAYINDMDNDLNLQYNFVIKYEAGTENKMADALSPVHLILISMVIQMVSFDSLKQDCSTCKDFKVIYEDLMAGQ